MSLIPQQSPQRYLAAAAPLFNDLREARDQFRRCGIRFAQTGTLDIWVRSRRHMGCRELDVSSKCGAKHG
jgi:hypothetical protein